MKISNQKLIEMLISNATYSEQIGFNNAIISLLKGTISSFHPLTKIIRKSHPDFLDDKRFNDMITSFLLDGRRLSAVKTIKDKTSLGLKESKDIMDEYDLIVQKRKNKIQDGI